MSERTDEFYVGYLPVGVRQMLILRFLVPAIGFALLAAASLLAMSTDPAGPGVWASETETIEGTLRVSPYAEIVTDDGLATIVVDAGKVGIRDGIESMAGQRVRAEGFPISRDGMSVLELLPGGEGLAPIDGSVRVGESVRGSGAEVELVGEVLDLKCFLGAMKPGHGVTHRGCAVLCVQGGIPPAVRDEDGAVHVLAGDDWRALNGELLDLVGIDARLVGRAIERDGVRYLLLSGFEKAGD